MRKIKIMSPATSANLGPGFDFLALSFNLYNVFIFEESDEFVEIGFDEIDENLVLSSYLYTFNYVNKKPVKVKMIMEENNIPSSRGIGSSASAILSGVLAANYFMNNVLSRDELVSILISLDKHRDNILAALYGGLVSSVVDGSKVYTYKTIVDKSLFFYLLVPDYPVKTSDARKILPKELSYEDCLYNSSRCYIAKEAFEKGDIETLKIALKDSIHEKYRKTLIKEFEQIEKIANDNDAILKVSGSGSTMLLITKNNSIILDKLSSFKNIEVIKTTINYNETKVIEL